MKKILYNALMASALFAAMVSCNKETGSENEIQKTVYPVYITAGKDLPARTTLESDGKVFWKSTDIVGVVSWDTENSKWVNADGTAGKCAIENADTYEPSNKATFVINRKKNTYEPRFMVYPYYSGATIEITNERNDISINLPEEQIAVPDQIPDNTVTMLGAIEGDNCSLKNICAVVKFTITASNVTELSFYGNSGEFVAGRDYIYTDDLSFCRKTTASKEKLTLKPASGAFTPGEYYFATWPNTFKKGFSICATYEDGTSAVRSTSNEITLERNTVYTKFGSEEGWTSPIVTGVAGDLGSADGTTATIYGVAPASMGENDEIGFETSADGNKWIKFDGTVTKRITESSGKKLNVFCASLTGLTPASETFYRAYFKRSGNDVVCYGKTLSFETVANAESVNMNFYNGFDAELWPLTSPEIGTNPDNIQKGNSSVAIAKGSNLNLVTSNGTFVTKNQKGVWCGTSIENPCLVMGGDIKDKDGNILDNYIKFPIIDGKAPVKVIFVVGNLGKVEDPNDSNNNMGRPSIVEFKEDGTEEGVTGGEQWNPLPCHVNDVHVWDLDFTKGGTQYGMYFNHSSNRYIRYFEVVYASVSVEPQPVTLDLVFSTRVGDTGGADNWPFVNAMGAYNKNPNVGPHNVNGLDKFKFTFNVQNFADTDCWRTTAGQGLRFGGTKGDYMAINAVEGYRLSHIKIRGGTQAITYSVKDTEGVVIDGGAAKATTTKADNVIEFDLTETSLNTEYRLYVGTEETAQKSAIRELWVSYDLE